MVNIILPYTESNPKQWLTGLTDITTIFLIKENNDRILDSLHIVVREQNGLESGFSVDSQKNYTVFQVAKVMSPVAIPYDITITSGEELDLTVIWTPEFNIDTPEVVEGTPDQWLSNITDIKTVFGIKETNLKSLLDFTIHLDDGTTIYQFKFSSDKEWEVFQVENLKPDITTPFNIGITSLLTLNMNIYKI